MKSRISVVRSEDASTMIEAAMVIPFLVLMLAGIIQYGFLFAGSLMLHSATAVGARYAAVINTAAGDSDVREVVEDALPPMMSADNLTSVTVQDVTLNGLPNAKQVTVEYNLPLFFSVVVPGASSGSITLEVVSTMR